MSISITANLNAQISWTAIDSGQTQNQNVADNSETVANLTFGTGVGPNSVNTVYIGSFGYAGFSGSENNNIDLFELPRYILGGEHTVSFSGGSILGLIIENVSTGSNPIMINFTGDNHFRTPFTIDNITGTSRHKLYPDNPFIISNNYYGFDVDENNRYIGVTTLDANINQIEISIIGKV